ncbi:MAG: hypothetical protein AAFY65_11815 [Pseudomonadota bacterium]
MSAQKFTALATIACLLLPQAAMAQKFVSATEDTATTQAPIVTTAPVLASAVLEDDPEALPLTYHERPDPDVWAATPGPEGNRGECTGSATFDVAVSGCVNN